MGKALKFNLGGLVVGFEPRPAELELLPFDSHRQFVCDTSPEIQITVRNQPPELPVLGAPLYYTGFWSYHEDPQHIFQMNTRSRGRFARKDTLIFAPGSASAELYVEQDLAAAAPDVPGLELPPFIMDELMAASFLAQRRGLHIHGCGLNAWGGQGLLLAGYSGAGKSTSARIWRASGAARLLSDERAALRWQDGRYWLHGTPWHSSVMDSSSPERVPLERIFILEHAPQNQARRLRPAAAVAALAARAFLPFWSQAGMASALELLEDLVRVVPCYQLGFVPDASIVEYVRCLSD